MRPYGTKDLLSQWLQSSIRQAHGAFELTSRWPRHNAMLAYARKILFACLALLALSAAAALAEDLPSWNDGPAKKSITQFVTRITTPGGSEFVPVEDRVAVFDNDGTLWAEQPLYIQLAFLLEQVKVAAPKHPEWKDNPVFKALAAHDQKALAALGLKPVLQLLGVANSGMTTAQYDQAIRDWLATARDPRFKVPYTESSLTCPCRNFSGICGPTVS